MLLVADGGMMDKALCFRLGFYLGVKKKKKKKELKDIIRCGAVAIKFGWVFPSHHYL